MPPTPLPPCLPASLPATLAQASTVPQWLSSLASSVLQSTKAHGVRLWWRESAAAEWQQLHEIGHGHTLASGPFVAGQPSQPLVQHLVFGRGALECIGAEQEALEQWQGLTPLLESALEGVQARERQQGHGRVAETVEALVRHLGGSLDLAEVLTKTAESAAVALRFERALVTLFSELGENMAQSSQVYTYGFQGVFAEGIQVGPVTLEALVRRGEAIRFERQRDQGTALASALQDLGPEAAVIAPLSARGQALGLLYVDTRQSGSAASEEDARLVLALAEQASLAIDNARLYALEIRKREGAEALREAGAALAASLRLSDTLSAVLHWAATLFGTDGVALYELQNNQRTLRICSALGLPSEYVLRAKAKRGTGITGQAVALQRAAYVQDVSFANYAGGSRYTRKLIAQGNYPYRGILSLPLGLPLSRRAATAHRHVAALTLYWKEPFPLDDHLLTLAGVFAAQASLALENARLYEEELRREKEAAVLLSLTTVLDGELSEHTWQQALGQVVQALGGWRGVLVLDEAGTQGGHGGEQVTTLGLGPVNQADLSSLRQQLGRGPRPLGPRFALEGASSALLVPLRSKQADADEQLGFLYIDDPQPELPPESTLQLAKKIAEQMTQSLTKRRLHLALRREEARYRQLSESAHDLILSTDATGQITYANPAATRLLTQALGTPPLGQSVWALSTQDTRSAWQAVLQQVLGQAQPAPQITEIQLGEGGMYRLEVRISPFGLGDEAGALLVARDLSELAELAEEIKQRGQDLEAATHRQSELRTFLALFTQAQEEERRRISRELHDDTAQVLVAIGRRISRLGRELTGEQAARAEDIRADLDDALASVRRFARNLRPSMLDDLGLMPALEWLCQQASTNSRLELSGNERRLSPVTELTIFRLCQEALANVDKHAGASSAAIRVHFHEQSVEVSIQDDGKGFSAQQAAAQAEEGHLGLLGLRERVALLGGQIQIDSVSGEGTTVRFELLG